MKKLIKGMRKGQCLLQAETNGIWFFEGGDVKKATPISLLRNGVIEKYQYLARQMAEYTLTDLGKTIQL